MATQNEVSEKAGASASFFGYIWRFFISIKLTLVLIVVIVILSLISIFLVQTPSGIDQGSELYNAWLEGVIRPDFGFWTDTLSFFGLFDVFHSFLFLGAGILLMVNIICCTVNRWPAVRGILRGGNIPTSRDYYLDAGPIHHTTSKADILNLIY